jgi:hypothetical protein
VITVTINKERRLSSSGNTLLVASETAEGEVSHNGAPVAVAVNAYTAVADWSRAGIGYTTTGTTHGRRHVADWSRARVGYTASNERRAASSESNCGLIAGRD